MAGAHISSVKSFVTSICLLLSLSAPLTAWGDGTCFQLTTKANLARATNQAAYQQAEFDRRAMERALSRLALAAAFAEPDLDGQSRYRRYVDETRQSIQGIELLPSGNAAARLITFYFEVQKLLRSWSSSTKHFAIALYGSIINGRSHRLSDLDYAVYELSLAGTRQWFPSIRNPAALLAPLLESQLGFSPRVTAPSDDPPTIEELHHFIVGKESSEVFISEVTWHTSRGTLAF